MDPLYELCKDGFEISLWVDQPAVVDVDVEDVEYEHLRGVLELGHARKLDVHIQP